jgi:hypothetical protein
MNWLMSGKKGWIISGVLVYFMIQIFWLMLSLSLEPLLGNLPGAMVNIIILGPPVVFLVLYFRMKWFATNFGVWATSGRDLEKCGPCGKSNVEGRKFDQAWPRNGQVFICNRCLHKHAKTVRFSISLFIAMFGFILIFVGFSFFGSHIGSSSSSHTSYTGTGRTTGTVTVSSPFLESIQGTFLAYIAGVVALGLGLAIFYGIYRILSAPIDPAELQKTGINILKNRDKALYS